MRALRLPMPSLSRTALLTALVALLACGDDGGDDDPTITERDAATPDGGAPGDDAATPLDLGPPVETATVEWPREMRGVWLTTVFNINWPSRQGLSASAQQAELIDLLDVAVASGLNTVFFQIRPECDAFYPSELEPWSRYLSGTQGEDPGWDPLAFAINEAHQRGLELHGWMNPYRAKGSSGSTAVAPHPAITLSEYAYPYGSTVWMDPGASEVQDHTLAVIEDVLARYDVDGLHFDDYFYPYPDGPFPDDATYAAYTAGGGTLARDDWRRDNVNQLVRRIGEMVAAMRPDVRFGISPFGIYRPGMPAGINGLDQYAAIYADPPLWLAEGWVDYLAPQLYWPSTQTAQAYQPLVEWWGALATEGHLIVPGNYLSKLGTEAAWSLDELRTQVDLTRATGGTGGNIYFQIEPFESNTLGVRDAFASEYYAQPALTPPLASAFGETLSIPSVTETADGVTVSHGETLRAVTVYQGADGGFAPTELIPAGDDPVSIALEPGRWAIAAVDRRGVESPAVVIER